MTNFTAATWAERWDGFWAGPIGQWFATKGLAIVVAVVFAILATRLINWSAQRISRRLARGGEGTGLVASEAVKHRQAVASVISSVAIAVLYVVVGMQVISELGLSVGSLVAPAAVLGAALGFGAQRIVQDLLSGFFVITEKQYGFGDLVRLSLTGSSLEATGTVVDVTLRVTKLRNSDGEVVTVPNGQISKTVNLSKDWARAVIDIPVPSGADLNRVNEVLHDVSRAAMEDHSALNSLLLDEPSVMGVESIQVDTVNVRMVARTLPGKQFDVGRQLRTLVISGLRRSGISTPAGATATVETMGTDFAPDQRTPAHTGAQ
ncbi:MAG: mechanosensitive ion channel family protein [Mycobacterium sp.]|nr:mechanosensitive ion channel family protein [Mycobacterium sp.]